VRRVRHAILILIGREPYRFSTERMDLAMALENFTIAAAALADAADRLIAHCEGHAAELAQAQSDLANADATATAAIQPVVDRINAALPATATQPPAA
jgi:hypothetical protein